MDNLDVADILNTYSEKARNAGSATKHKEIIREFKKELDLRKIDENIIGIRK